MPSFAGPSVLGVNIELHAVPERDAAKLIDRLRAHAEREEQVLYPWIEATLMILRSVANATAPGTVVATTSAR